MKSRTLAVVGFSLALVFIAACSHLPSNGRACDPNQLKELTFQALDGGYFYSQNVRRVSVDELRGSWILVGEYQKTLDGYYLNEFDISGIKSTQYAKLALSADSKLPMREVVLTPSPELTASRPEAYDLEVIGQFADAINYGARDPYRIKQAIRIQQQCDSLLIKWRSSDRRLHYLVYIRGQ